MNYLCIHIGLVVMYWCESWTIKKAEHQRIVPFKLRCWRILLIVPWAARRSNQSNLVEINSEYSLEGLMLKLKLQYFGHLMRRADSLEKDPDAGKDWRWEEKGTTEDEMVGWHHQLDRRVWANSRAGRSHSEIHWVARSWTWPSDWTTTATSQEKP